ncbi:MAG: alpha/beta hydrolase [Candidatus Binatia bacterium]|nr:alpha/beta hydrolase [Candidatus Binatia bacterium]
MVSLSPPRFEGAFRLEDGRELGYAEFGPATGFPILWFHGTPGACRQIAPATREACWKRDVRLVAVERPGIGASTPHAYSGIVDFAHDIGQLTRALAIERFGMVGLSGGGPYTLACAHEMPDRVVGVAILGGVAPSVGPDAPEGGAVSITPVVGPALAFLRGPLGFGMRGLVQVLKPLADPATDLFLQLLPPGDAKVFSDPATRRMFHEDLIHGSRDWMQALFLDVALFGKPWGFALGDVRVPVHLLYGDADNIVPLEHGRHMAGLLPHSTLDVRPQEGHLGGLGATDEIFDALLGEADVEAEPVTPPTLLRR